MAALAETLNLSLLAQQYVKNGWSLVPVESGVKWPKGLGWNRAENCVSTIAGCRRIKANVGLAHAFSGTCVIDLDDFEKGKEWLAEQGVDLSEFWNAVDAVKINSGVANRGKLLFKLPPGIAPLVSVSVASAKLELRCAAANGRTFQDLLPPSIHPKTGNPYQWEFDPMLGGWDSPPELPPALLRVWQSQVNADVKDCFISAEPGRCDRERAEEVLSRLDTEMRYHDWVKVGMALHHEFGADYEGFQLWDEWSSLSSLYKGEDDLEFHWRSFKVDRDGARATLDTLESDLRRKPISPDEFLALMDAPEIVAGGADEAADSEPMAEPEPVAVSEGGADPADGFDDLGPEEDAPETPAAPPAKKTTGFTFQTIDEFLNRAPPSWIIKGILPRASLGVIYGDSGTGKTFFALDQAMSVALGKDWRGAKTKQGSVAYIVAEGATGFQDRVLAYCRAHDVDRGSLPIRVLAAAPDMMDTKKESTHGVIALGKALKELGPLSIIYVDTYARVMTAGNENEAKDTNLVVANCQLLHRLTGAIVVLIHHSGKDGSRGARGSGALRAAADVEYFVSKATARHTVKITKMKDGEDGKEYCFRLNGVVVGMDEDGDDRSSCVVEHMDDVPSAAQQVEEAGVKPTSEVQMRLLAQMGTYLSGEVTEENFILDVREITPLGPNGVENPSWKALITRPLQKMIDKGLICRSNGMLYLPKTASD